MFKLTVTAIPALCLLLLTLGDFAQHVHSMSMKFQYGGEWVNVGDANLQWFAYSQAYNHFNQYGGQFDLNAQAWTHHVTVNGFLPPYSYPGPDVTFDLSAQAEYGTGPHHLTGWNFRDLLIHTMSDGISKLTAPTHWAICVPHLNCMANYVTSCPNSCTDMHWGHKMPSFLRVNVYNDDGSLRPEFYEIRLTNYKAGAGKGCSSALKSFGMALGLVPEFGGFLSTIIGVNCLFQ